MQVSAARHGDGLVTVKPRITCVAIPATVEKITPRAISSGLINSAKFACRDRGTSTCRRNLLRALDGGAEAFQVSQARGCVPVEAATHSRRCERSAPARHRRSGDSSHQHARRDVSNLRAGLSEQRELSHRAFASMARSSSSVVSGNASMISGHDERGRTFRTFHIRTARGSLLIARASL